MGGDRARKIFEIHLVFMVVGILLISHAIITYWPVSINEIEPDWEYYSIGYNRSCVSVDLNTIVCRINPDELKPINFTMGFKAQNEKASPTEMWAHLEGGGFVFGTFENYTYALVENKSLSADGGQANESIRWKTEGEYSVLRVSLILNKSYLEVVQPFQSELWLKVGSKSGLSETITIILWYPEAAPPQIQTDGTRAGTLAVANAAAGHNNCYQVRAGSPKLATPTSDNLLVNGNKITSRGVASRV